MSPFPRERPAATVRGRAHQRRGARRDEPASGRPADPSPEVRGPRLPSAVALALITAVSLAGLLYLVARLAGQVRVFLPEAALAALLGLVTLLLGFWALCRIRPVRDPAPVPCLAALLWGLTAAPAAGIIANEGLGAVWVKGMGLSFSEAWGAALSAPVNEEVLKLAGVVLVAVALPSAVRGPVDGFTVGSLVGLGFEVTENFVYALTTVIVAGGTDGLTPVVQSAVLRVGLTGLGSHWAMSAVAGTAVGLLAAAAWRPGALRLSFSVFLVAVAMALHWLLDAPLFDDVPGTLSRVAVVFLSTMAVYAAVRRVHRRRVREALAAEGAALGMPRPAATALVTRHGRERELRRVPAPERPAVRRRQEQMVESAEERAARGDPPADTG